LFLTETWLSSTHSDAFIQQPNFQIFRNNRETRIGGGVAILVHNKLGAREVSVVIPSGVNFEIVCVDVHLNLKSSVTRCICIYRPPNIRHNNRQDSLLLINCIQILTPKKDSLLLPEILICLLFHGQLWTVHNTVYMTHFCYIS